MQKLFIISNEKIYIDNNTYYCDNIDLKSTPEGLSNNFEVNLIARKSKVKRSHKINISNIKIFGTFISFICGVINLTKKDKEAKYLLISISPYTFFACIFLKLLKKRPIIYLRSNGFDEYKIKLGHIGYFIYYLMFNISTAVSKIVSCRKYILRGKKGYTIHPSQLNNKWFENHKEIKNKQKNLLYVGRVRKEKGIFSLIDIIKNTDIDLTVVGEEDNKIDLKNYKNINFIKIINNKHDLIKLYDDHNIFILPSYTEGQPMALLESLSRLRPVIIFDDIEHVIQNRAGIFISKRNYESLNKTIHHINTNYESIQELMKKNQLPMFKDFVKNLTNIILEDK
tara:strand:- start:750 stop:1769 length:1020 start_codon:yes stop_codon:yes gene_type:complete